MAGPQIIVGVDLPNGVAVLEPSGQKLTTYQVEGLAALDSRLRIIFAAFDVIACGYESPVLSNRGQSLACTAAANIRAEGVVQAACAAFEVRCVSISPKAAKSCVAGTPDATKAAVKDGINALYGTKLKPGHEADAAAVATELWNRLAGKRRR